MTDMEAIMPLDEDERSFWLRFYALAKPVILQDAVRQPDPDETPLSPSEIDFCISRGIRCV